MKSDDKNVVEIVGEGKTDIGDSDEIGPPKKGVVPILLHRLCGQPSGMLVKGKKWADLQQGKSVARKVWFAKVQARLKRRTCALVVVRDSDGDMKATTKKRKELAEGRDAGFPDFPMVVGVAQPCIETWLLADGTAIRRAMGLASTPVVPGEPEELPADYRDADCGPKRVLAQAAGSNQADLSADDKHSIARAMNNMDLVRQRCPLGFAPFADEVNQFIRPLFPAS